MGLLHLLRSRRSGSHRRPLWFNAGFFYGALAGLGFVVGKTLKYADGRVQRDLPWAVLVVLIAGFVGSLVLHLARLLRFPRGHPPNRPPGSDNSLKT